MCKLCVRMDYDDFVYKDAFCTIIGNANELTCIYKWHITPSHKHKAWIEQQLYIVASKMWNQSWGYKYHKTETHPHWIATPYRSNRVRVMDKKHEIKNKVKEIE